MAWSIVFNSLFYILTTQFATAQSSPFRGNFIPPVTTATLLEGDILVPESQVGRGPEELDALLSDPELLWPNGYVPYCFETFEWEGSKEPIFLDDQIANVTKALRQISKDVPCIKFKWVTSKIKLKIDYGFPPKESGRRPRWQPPNFHSLPWKWLLLWRWSRHVWTWAGGQPGVGGVSGYWKRHP